MSLSTIRHDHIFKARDNNIPISIIGCGATGSRVFMSLIELGLTNISCFDFDVVEAHNLANQAYHDNHIGEPKVDALAMLFRAKTGTPPPVGMHFHNVKLPDTTRAPSGLVFLLVDTFAARKEIAEKCLINNDKVFYVIETRMASMHGNVLAFNPQSATDTATWLASLGSDDPDAAELSPCGTSLSVGPTAAVLANLAVWQMINWLTNPPGHDQWTELFLRPFILTTRSKL